MQTFLPYSDFKKSLQILDKKRLNKQKVENLQLLNIILNRTNTKGWRNHPAKRMWENFPAALQLYQNCTIDECINRDMRNTLQYEIIPDIIIFPTWLGNEDFHRSHRSNLLRKDKEYYSKFFDEPDNLPYIWPI